MQKDKIKHQELASEGNRRQKVNRAQGGFNTQLCSVLNVPPPLLL